MIDFELNTGNMVKQESMTITMQGKMNPKLRGVEMKVEYRLHKDEFRNPDDPEVPLTLFCIHCPQINMTYIDKTEADVFDAMLEFFEEDFIQYFAQKLVEEREAMKDE